ncbi:MAG: helix-turn-helix domain-containing protein [Oscillospiraceae bacterium]|nr:helix-turn-helix domain-containing protein [Oscillospiraceae bacterium]
MKNLDFVLLLDCYGSFLTEKQRELLEGYYNDDLSLSELAEPLGISRQAVYDRIHRGERRLEELETQIGVAARLKAARAVFEEIENLSSTLSEPAAEKIGEAARKGAALFR